MESKEIIKKQSIKEELFIYDRCNKVRGYDNLVEVILNGKTGIIDISYQREVVPCKYHCESSGSHGYISDYYIFSEKETCVNYYYSKSSWKEIESLREQVLYYIFSQSNNRIVRRRDKKFIIQDKDGKSIYSILFDEFKVIKNYAVLVQANKKWGLLDQMQGEFAIPCEYDDYTLISDNVIALKSNDKWGIANLEHIKLTVACKFEEVKCFNDEMIPVKLNGKWGFINKHTWNIQIPCTYSNVEPFNGENAAVEQRKKWGVINKKNEKVLLSIYEKAIPIPGGLTIVWEEKSASCSIIDNQKRIIYHGHGNYDEIIERDNVEVYEKIGIWKYGLLSIKTGKLVIPCEYRHIWYDSDRNGLLRLTSADGKKGLYNLYLKRVVVPCRYDTVWCSHWNSQSIYPVEINGVSGKFDEKIWREEIPCNYSVRGYNGEKNLRTEGNALAVGKDGKWGLVERSTWNELLPCVFEDNCFISSTIIAFKKNGKWGFFNDKGKQIETCHTIQNETSKIIGKIKFNAVDQKEYKKERVQLKDIEDDHKVKKENVEKAAPKASSEADNVPWAEILWTPLKDHLDKVPKIKGSKPADRSYTIYKIKTIDAQIVPWYKVKTNEAGVALETYGGNEVKSIIEKILSKAPANSIVRQAELSQGKKNKDKWNWTIIAEIDKNDNRIIQWYADAILAFSSLIDG